MATHNSPKGRPVEVVLGNAGDIEDRGQQIVNLGAAMTDASSLLNRLVDNGADMEGMRSTRCARRRATSTRLSATPPECTSVPGRTSATTDRRWPR